jgi:hypothetical protein
MRMRRTHVIAVALAPWPAVAALLALPAAAGACGAVITPAAVASALHLPQAEEETLLTPPGPAWSVESSCIIDVWSGTRPLSRAAVETGFASGTYAVVSITMWRPAGGLLLGGAQPGFRETLATAKHEGRTQIVKELHGKPYTPPQRGARAVGWKAAQPSLSVARGVWWLRKRLRILQIGLREGPKHSATAGLYRLSATAVHAFGL